MCINVDSPLIAGTNRRPICCVLALRWRTFTVIDHTLLISLEINNWCLCTFTYLWPTLTVASAARHWLTSENEEWLVTWRTLRELNWSKGPFEYLVIKSPFIDFKEVVIWSLIVRSVSCDWRCGRISRWAGFREKRRWSDEHLYPSTVIGDRVWSRDVFMLKIASRWQYVNQWKSTTMTASSEDSGSTKQITSSWDEHC